MLDFLLTVLAWVPVFFDWAILPVAVLLIALAARGSTRGVAANGFLIAASVSAALLSLLLASSVFHLVGYGRAVADLLLNFGPSVTENYIGTLIRQNGRGLLALVPMVLTIFFSSMAALYLRKASAPTR
ncbi:MAG TPA: hypothetical protein VHU18_09505 [Rhizomicrobium sp.]|jgi:hypothetical protein|nr:hypothetical protein [Rhizomicrobium sp.]